MTGHESIWRLRLWVWVPALLFFLANAAAFTVYRLGYAGDVQTLKRELEREKKQLQTQEQERHQQEALLARAKANRDRIDLLYRDRFSTRRQRLTSVNAEVRRLAKQAGLEPRAITFPEETIDDYGLVKRSFIFPVEGSYPALRRFINLLEQSNSFLILEEINLNQGGGGGQESGALRISLKLSTLFRNEAATPVPPVPPARRARTAGGVS